MKDNFSQQSSLYAQYRPDYPPALFEHILKFVPHKKAAWDCATGNGQAAVALSKHFNKVIATDSSSKQLHNAEKAGNIFYSQQPAEQTNIESNSINLITVAQAIHWFKFERFYAEAVRVAADNSVIAVWCYSLLRICEPINSILDEYHLNTLAGYWDAERKYVDEGYQNIPFPFEKLASPSFTIEKYWTLDELEGYLNTWSALQKYIAVNSSNPVPKLIKTIEPYWSKTGQQKISFPIHLRLGRIK